MAITSHDSETPAHGQQVITACALIHHSFDGVDKVFVARRAATKKFLPDIYEIPGGHIDFGENIVAGLKREIREEFEVDIEIGDPFAVFDYTNEVKGSHSVEIIYFATLVGQPEAIKLHPDDHSEARWLAATEMDVLSANNKGPDDPEFIAITRAFALLNGSPPNFA